MTEPVVYTNEQKQELSRLFAMVWYDALHDSRSVSMADLGRRLLAEARERFEWFRFDGNEYAVLRYLEEADVYGIYWFFPERKCQLYLRVFSPKFRKFAKQRGLSKEGFVRGFMHPNSGAQKPTKDILRGNITDAGQKRHHNHYSVT